MPIDCLCCLNYIEILKNVNHAQHTEMILQGPCGEIYHLTPHVLDRPCVACLLISLERVFPCRNCLPFVLQYVLVCVIYDTQWHL